MIFYFTGTGNSYDAACQIKGEDRLLSIAELVKNRMYTFELGEDESLGFVFPVYFCGIPSIVRHFLSKLKLNRTPVYTYAVITCGAKIYGAGGMLQKKLASEGITLNAVFPVVMPDNYILHYTPDPPETWPGVLEAAKEKLSEIREQILRREETKVTPGVTDKMVTAAAYPMYLKGRKTDRFYTDQQCVGCGTCAKRCPAQAIEMKDGKPVWVKERCIQCMSCLRCNAVQYGKKTVGRPRYTNPQLKTKKKSCCD